jgi:hypothetical protein
LRYEERGLVVMSVAEREQASSDFLETADLLRKNGHPVDRVIAVRSAGDVLDGGGDEILYVAPEASPMIARVREGEIVVTEGWDV